MAQQITTPATESREGEHFAPLVGVLPDHADLIISRMLGRPRPAIPYIVYRSSEITAAGMHSMASGLEGDESFDGWPVSGDLLALQRGGAVSPGYHCRECAAKITGFQPTR